MNLDTAVHYVGKQQCRSCHPDIYNTFIETGMGKSFEKASRSKSAATFGKSHLVYDVKSDFYYYPFWLKDSMYVLEFRLKGKDTIYKRIEKVDYIIGSGQHTNSHFTSFNGYIYQIPLTWYAQKKQWDLPPGFENGRNVRFSRSIGFECMSCHNALPTLANGSVNKFINIPDGIDCERCHGPGQLHVKEKLAGNIVDTSTQIDFTIVNPKKLSWERQIDVCQRCHLQGNAVLKSGKQFSDFKPGMILSDILEVYLPKYKGRGDEFIMASHAQRLQESKCFIESNKKSIKKVGSAFETLNLTCITCHNPHVSVKVTGAVVFNQACLNCHNSKNACKENKVNRLAEENNCVKCHMPKSGSVDIPHVTVHDHKIKIPINKQKLAAIKIFAGIYCVNNPKTSFESKAAAYLNYFEKFEGEKTVLDSSFFYLQMVKEDESFVGLMIHHLFLKQDYLAISKLAENMKLAQINDAWLAYRIGQAQQNNGYLKQAELAYKRAIEIAPDNLEFYTKMGAVLILEQQFESAIVVLERSLNKQNKQENAWVNIGFAYLNLNEIEKAEDCYNKALQLNPDLAQALLNRAAVYNLKGEKSKAIRDLKQILVKDPENIDVKQLLKSLVANSKH